MPAAGPAAEIVAGPSEGAHARRVVPVPATVVKRGVTRTGLLPTFRFHHLRHTGLSLLAEAGASMAELQARAGHATAGIAVR